MVGEQVWRDYGSLSGVNYDSVILATVCIGENENLGIVFSPCLSVIIVQWNHCGVIDQGNVSADHLKPANMGHLGQTLSILGHCVEDSADGIHGELVPVNDDERTDWPIEYLRCDMRTARSRVELVRYLYPFPKDCLLPNTSVERCRDSDYLKCLRLQYRPSYRREENQLEYTALIVNYKNLPIKSPV